MADLPSLARLLSSTTNPRAREAIKIQIEIATRRNRYEKQQSSVRDQIISCRNCQLGYERNKAVPYVGPTHGQADLVLVGEAPGNTEDRRGEPFVGWAGEMLDHLLLSAGTSRDRCFIMNALCCIPRGDDGRSFREPAQPELDACRPNFNAQLELSGCKVGVALGGYAWGAVRQLPRSMIRVKPLLEKVFWVDGRIWIVTYHPSYVRRNVGTVDRMMNPTDPEDEKQEIGREVVKSLQWALAIAKGDIMIPKIPWGDFLFGGKRSEVLATALQKKGWALHDSPVFGCQIVIVDDFKRAPKLPPALRQVPIYTLSELWKLGLVGADTCHWTTADMRRLHYVKVEMGGEVVM